MREGVGSVLGVVVLILAGCADSETPTAPPAPASSTPTSTPPAPVTRELASDPARIADDLVADENALHDPSSPEDLLTAAAHRQQLAYRAIGRHPEWDAVVRPRIPGPLLDVYDRNVDARRHLGALSEAAPAATLPAWRVIEPAPADDLLGYYREAEAATGVAWTHLAAINMIETRVGRISGTSTAGAQGPMQFLPSTFAQYSDGDINSPRDSIMAAGKMLAANGFGSNPDVAVYSYNNSDDYVRAVDDYAAVLTADPAAFTGYYRWQVWVNTTMGDVLLPTGYDQPAPIAVTDYLPQTPPTSAAVRISPASEATLARILAARTTAQADPDALSAQFLGTPYGANTLVGSETVPEELVVDLDEVDCFTYADYLEALKRAGNRDEFVEALTDVRYRDGVVAFSNRKHFFTDWAANTPELATDVTATLSPAAVQVGKNLNAKDTGGVYLPGLPVIPRAVTYIPSAGVDADVVSRLRTGDYIGAYATDGGLDVTHVGVFVNGTSGPVFRNSSSLSRYNAVVDQPLAEYLQSVPGIVVLRPVL